MTKETKVIPFSDIKNIPKKALMYMGAGSLALPETDNFSDNFLFYFNNGLLPFLKTEEEAKKYLNLMVERNLSEKFYLRSGKRIVVQGFLGDPQTPTKKKICKKDLEVFGKITLVFMAQNVFNIYPKDIHHIVDYSNERFGFSKKDMISKLSQAYWHREIVARQIFDSGINQKLFSEQQTQEQGE